jgi:hypothetical protein
MSNTNVLFPSGVSNISNISAPLDMNGFRIEEVGVPDSNDDAVNYGLLLSTVGQWASVPASGAVNMSGYKISGLGAPSANGDATTKAYVDTSVANSTSGLLVNVVQNPIQADIAGNQKSLTNLDQLASNTLGTHSVSISNVTTAPVTNQNLIRLTDGTGQLRNLYDDGTGNIYMTVRDANPGFGNAYQYVMTSNNSMLINNLQTGVEDAIEIKLNHSGTNLSRKYRDNTSVMNKYGVKALISTNVGNNTNIYREFQQLLDIPASYNNNHLAFRIDSTSSANFFHNSDGNYHIANTAGYMQIPVDTNILNGDWTIHTRFRATLSNNDHFRFIFSLNDSARQGNTTGSRHVSILRTNGGSTPDLQCIVSLDTSSPLEADTTISNSGGSVFGDYTSEFYNMFIVSTSGENLLWYVQNNSGVNMASSPYTLSDTSGFYAVRSNYQNIWLGRSPDNTLSDLTNTDYSHLNFFGKALTLAETQAVSTACATQDTTTFNSIVLKNFNGAQNKILNATASVFNLTEEMNYIYWNQNFNSTITLSNLVLNPYNVGKEWTIINDSTIRTVGLNTSGVTLTGAIAVYPKCSVKILRTNTSGNYYAQQISPYGQNATHVRLNPSSTSGWRWITNIGANLDNSFQSVAYSPERGCILANYDNSVAITMSTAKTGGAFGYTTRFYNRFQSQAPSFTTTGVDTNNTSGTVLSTLNMGNNFLTIGEDVANFFPTSHLNETSTVRFRNGAGNTGVIVRGGGATDNALAARLVLTNSYPLYTEDDRGLGIDYMFQTEANNNLSTIDNPNNSRFRFRAVDRVGAALGREVWEVIPNTSGSRPYGSYQFRFDTSGVRELTIGYMQSGGTTSAYGNVIVNNSGSLVRSTRTQEYSSLALNRSATNPLTQSITTSYALLNPSGINAVAVSEVSSSFTNTSGFRSTYTGAYTRAFKINFGLSIQSGADIVYTVNLRKNGSDNREIVFNTAIYGIGNCSYSYIESVAQNDYFEMFIKNDTGTQSTSIYTTYLTFESVN